MELIAEMELTLASMQGGVRDVFRAAYTQNANLVMLKGPEIYAGFGATDAGRLRAARAAFKAGARRQFGLGMKEWADRFQDASGTLKAGMQRTLVEGQLNGWNQRQIAESFLKQPEFQFKNLPALGTRGERIFTMGGKLSPSDALVRRAHVIARTELNAVNNRFIQMEGEARGAKLWVNQNGSPVAEECIAANAAGAMTLAEWDAGLGKPPRHPNCDSSLFPVPDDYDEEEILAGGITTNKNPHLPG